MGGNISDYQYTVEVPGTQEPGQTGIYLHPEAKPYLTTSLASGATTLYELVQNSYEKYSSLPFIGTREPSKYTWYTYSSLVSASKSIGKALKALGIAAQDPLGIYAKNRLEWILMDLACIFQSIVSVPIYEMLQADNIEVILSETSMKIIACSGYLVKNILKFKKDSKLPLLSHIISFDCIPNDLLDLARDANVSLHQLNELIERDVDGEDHPPSPSSVFTICYTSGTTGRKKGAVITHKNITATIAGVLGNHFIFNSEDVHLSYLPLSHMMERTILYTMIECGSRIGMYGGDSLKIRDDLALLKPTVFVSVPRLFNRIYELIIQQFNDSSGLSKFFINKALDDKMNSYHNYKSLKSQIWDNLVFSSVRNTLGGRIKFMLTGSAPITGEVLTFLRVVFSCPIVEGYGQTESCAASFVTMPQDFECGHVGGPIPNLEAKLIDVPEMKYFSTDTDIIGSKAPRGELCLRGPTIFIGYITEEDNQDSLDKDGWLHTGDIAIRLSHNGAFKIIDRKKNFFKLAQGEYVATEKIESVYLKSQFISQIFVYGDSFKSFLIAVIVPNESHIRKHWALEKGLENCSFEQLCSRQDLKSDILCDMDIKANDYKLFGYEQVKKIHLESKPWTTGNLLTPTLKLMRYQIKMSYQGVIAELYSE